MSKFKNTEELEKAYKELEKEFTKKSQKLAESEKKLNQYPYKNHVIEKQYEYLKEGIKFRVENNIINAWQQVYHCIDVLCEKHKARIRDIENQICHIEKLEKQNNDYSDSLTKVLNENADIVFKLAELEEQLKNAIMPKFKIGQKVWAIVWEDFIGEKYNYRIIEGIIDHLFINRDNKISYGTMCQSFRSENLFATEEEAKLKLEELERKYDKLHKTNKL